MEKEKVGEGSMRRIGTIRPSNGGVRGLGLITRFAPDVPVGIVIGTGVVLAGVGSLGSYHCFDSLSLSKRTWGKIGLTIAGITTGVMALDGAILIISGISDAFGGLTFDKGRYVV